MNVRVGDVVYAEGASAILGDVISVSDEGVVVIWRQTTTTEQPEDLVVTIEPYEPLPEMERLTESSQVVAGLEDAFADEHQPPEHLADAWGRYNAGESITPAELRALDEWRTARDESDG